MEADKPMHQEDDRPPPGQSVTARISHSVRDVRMTWTFKGLSDRMLKMFREPELADEITFLIVDACGPNLTPAEAHALFRPLLKLLASFKDANRPSSRMVVILHGSLLGQLLSHIEGAVLKVKRTSRAAVLTECNAIFEAHFTELEKGVCFGTQLSGANGALMLSLYMWKRAGDNADTAVFGNRKWASKRASDMRVGQVPNAAAALVLRWDAMAETVKVIVRVAIIGKMLQHVEGALLRAVEACDCLPRACRRAFVDSAMTYIRENLGELSCGRLEPEDMLSGPEANSPAYPCTEEAGPPAPYFLAKTVGGVACATVTFLRSPDYTLGDVKTEFTGTACPSASKDTSPAGPEAVATKLAMAVGGMVDLQQLAADVKPLQSFMRTLRGPLEAFANGARAAQDAARKVDTVMRLAEVLGEALQEAGATPERVCADLDWVLNTGLLVSNFSALIPWLAPDGIAGDLPAAAMLEPVCGCITFVVKALLPSAETASNKPLVNALYGALRAAVPGCDLLPRRSEVRMRLQEEEARLRGMRKEMTATERHHQLASLCADGPAGRLTPVCEVAPPVPPADSVARPWEATATAAAAGSGSGAAPAAPWAAAEDPALAASGQAGPGPAAATSASEVQPLFAPWVATATAPVAAPGAMAAAAMAPQVGVGQRQQQQQQQQQRLESAGPLTPPPQQQQREPMPHVCGATAPFTPSTAQAGPLPQQPRQPLVEVITGLEALLLHCPTEMAVAANDVAAASQTLGADEEARRLQQEAKAAGGAGTQGAAAPAPAEAVGPTAAPAVVAPGPSRKRVSKEPEPLDSTATSTGYLRKQSGLGGGAASSRAGAAPRVAVTVKRSAKTKTAAAGVQTTAANQQPEGPRAGNTACSSGPLLSAPATAAAEPGAGASTPVRRAGSSRREASMAGAAAPQAEQAATPLRDIQARSSAPAAASPASSPLVAGVALGAASPAFNTTVKLDIEREAWHKNAKIVGPRD